MRNNINDILAAISRFAVSALFTSRGNRVSILSEKGVDAGLDQCAIITS